MADRAQSGRPPRRPPTPDGRPWPSQEVLHVGQSHCDRAATKFRPLGDRVVIEPIPREEMTKSGIVLPDTAKEKPQEGKVIAVGPGAFDNDGKRIAIDVKAGDKVLYAKYAGTEFKVDGEELLIVARRTSSRSSRADARPAPSLDPTFLEDTNWLSN